MKLTKTDQNRINIYGAAIQALFPDKTLSSPELAEAIRKIIGMKTTRLKFIKWNFASLIDFEYVEKPERNKYLLSDKGKGIIQVLGTDSPIFQDLMKGVLFLHLRDMLKNEGKLKN